MSTWASNNYENNNDVKLAEKATATATITATPTNKMTDTGTTNSPQTSSSPKRYRHKPSNKPPKRCCSCVHLNNLWSLWYGIFGTALQIYIAIKCVKRILGYSFLNWPDSFPLPYIELNCSLGLIGAAILLLPIFLLSTLFKIGNLANDGFKLGRQLSTCSKEPASEILSSSSCPLFRHGGPTAPFIHLVIAFCFLIPKLLMEARLIEAGFLSREWLWRTDLDFMGLHKDRMIILSFVTANTTTTTTTIAPSIRRAPLLPGMDPKALAFTSQSFSADTVIKTLKDIVGHENHTSYYENNQIETGFGSSVSVEYMNLVVALMVYSVRYPALFWSTNKCLGIIFSIQLLINGIHTLLGYAGMAILYKVQILGGWTALPLLKPETTFFRLNKLTPFLLNPQVTLLLYILSTLLILASSLVLYLYGHTRFTAFLNHERERKVITLKKSSSFKWSYFAHCAALCVLIAVGVCNAPLLHDYTVLYKGSLDDTTLVCIVGGILHLFLWIVIWLFLTIKQSWIFKLRVTVGKATVRQARSLRLITDIDLMASKFDDLSQQPLLIVGNGRTYNISETSPKRAIMNVIQKAAMNKKSNGSINQDDDEEQIYWLRPALVTPQQSPDDAKNCCWSKNKAKHKVTFNETASTSANRNKNGGIRSRRLTTMDEDDGDYATLRELPLPPPSCRRPESREDTCSEEGKLLACVQDEHVTYASNNQDLVPPVDYEDPSPLLTPEPLCSVQKTPATAVIVHNHETAVQVNQQTPRCLRRADSGVPHEELTPKSDSLSTESSSPPEGPGSNHSETSSGVHSNDSGEQKQTRRANSVVDLVQSREEIHWKSSSLTRNAQPCSYSNTPKAEVLPNNGVILENPAESTVVIRRKIVRPVTADVSQAIGIKDEPFGRATNMRMTSFMEKNDMNNHVVQTSSATLPHFPTQTLPNVYSHCSTMPLPQHTNLQNAQNHLIAGNSCNVYPRQHTTLPTHHNGVKLYNPQNPHITRFKCKQNDLIKPNINEAIYTGVNKNGDIYRYNT